MTFFEERSEEARRDAERIEIMKQALVAKRRFIMAASEKGDPLAKHVPVDVFVDEVHETKKGDGKEKKVGGIFGFGGWGGKKAEDNGEEAASAQSGGASAATSPASSSMFKVPSISGAAGSTAARGSKLPPPPPPPAAATFAPPKSPPPKPTGPTQGCKSGYSDVDEEGPLPAGWILQWDDWDNDAGSADKWYSNAAQGSTSWKRPNPDGTFDQ